MQWRAPYRHATQALLLVFILSVAKMGKRKLEQEDLDFVECHFRALRVFLSGLRQERGLSQEKVSLVGKMGRKAPGRIERGDAKPGFETLLLLARGFGMSPAAFLRALAEHIEGQAKAEHVLPAKRYYADDASHWVEIRFGDGQMTRPTDGGRNRPSTGPT